MEITVTGSNSATLPAECVVIALTAGFSGALRDAVMRDTAALADTLRARLEAVTADGGGSDARLSGLRTWTTIPSDDRARPTTPQHVAQVRGSVRIQDLTRVADFLGGLSTMDGVQIGQLDWRLSDETLERLQPEVLAGAYADARRRAGWIAAAAGRSTPEVVAIDDGASQSHPHPRARFAMVAFDSGVPSFNLDPEDVEVATTLSVKFTTD